MKLIKTLFTFLALFVGLCFLDAVFFGEIQHRDNAVFAALVSVVILIALYLSEQIKRIDQ